MELENFINHENGNDANRLLAVGFLSFFNKNGFVNILNRISLNSLTEVKDIFYYNILRDKIQKTFNV
jgi:hypothetical protein